jgi:hypothetical protein
LQKRWDRGLGKVGETFIVNTQKTGIFRLKKAKFKRFSNIRFSSDSVIRVFESLRPSQILGIFRLFQLENAFIFCFWKFLK